MIRAHLSVVAFCVMWLLPVGAAAAQTGAVHGSLLSSQSVAAPDAAQAGLSSKQVGISATQVARYAATRADETPAPAPAQRRQRDGRVLMIVGGAAFLAGLLIGDDVGTAIAVGGAAVGLYGLYLWAQSGGVASR
ncbi:MAG: hypothetical protein ACT4R6_06890 [Gemmatimonadaceae bacterium]